MYFTRAEILDRLHEGRSWATTRKGGRHIIGTTDDYALAKDDRGRVTLIPYRDIYSLEVTA